MSGNLEAVVQYPMHQRPGFRTGIRCQATGRQLYSIKCIKDLTSCQGFDIRQVGGSCIIFNASKTWLQARVLIPVNWRVVQPPMLQRPGFRTRFRCLETGRQLYSLPCIKDLASCQGFDVRQLGDTCIASHASKTWLQARVLMSGNWATVVVFHASKTWLHARVLMSGNWETLV